MYFEGIDLGYIIKNFNSLIVFVVNFSFVLLILKYILAIILITDQLVNKLNDSV